MFYIYDVTVGIRPREVDFSRHPDPQVRAHHRRYLSTRDADPIGVVEQHVSEAGAARAVAALNAHEKRRGRWGCYVYIDGATLTRPVPPAGKRR